MRQILITAAEILVWIFFVFAVIIFGLMTGFALKVLFNGFFFLGWFYELMAIIIAAFTLSGSIVMKASQDILKQKLESKE